MKQIFTVITIFILSISCILGQQGSTLVVFSTDGLPFDLILNGVKQNWEKETNVRVEGLTQPYYNAKIIFKDENLKMIDKKHLVVMGVDGELLEATYIIKTNKKGELKLVNYSAIPIQTAPPAPTDAVVFVYTEEPRNNTITTTTITETSIIGTTHEIEEPNEGVSLDVNLGGVSVDMDVNLGSTGNMDSNVEIIEHSSTTITTTTTTSDQGRLEPRPAIQPTNQGNNGCRGYPMSDYDFDQAKNSIDGKTFEDSKLTLAKQIADSNCIKAAQVRDIIKLFTHESTRLEFAKHAYARVFDPKNYYLVSDGFKFDMTSDELNEFIKE